MKLLFRLRLTCCHETIVYISIHGLHKCAHGVNVATLSFGGLWEPTVVSHDIGDDLASAVFCYSPPVDYGR